MTRGISPVVGVVCLVAVTAVLASVVAVTVPVGSTPEPTVTAFDATADPGGEVSVTHSGGDVIDPEALEVRIEIDGEPLAEQPPVPFFSAAGFDSGPIGAFNSATTEPWRAGETASLTVAGTNEPAIHPGDTVRIQIYVDGYSAATTEATA